VNFFGHAWVAAWFSDGAPFVLGAMLPDFSSALRVGAPSSGDEELSAGVRLHHATDSAFHDAVAFRALEEEARHSLSALGIPKGPRRALAHVGVEFLIDEHLARRAPAWAPYERALQFGASEASSAALSWAVPGTSARFRALCQRLASSSATLVDASALVARLVGALSGRPRLELQPSQIPLLEPWLAECRPGVSAAMPALLGELAHGLGAAGQAERASASRAVLHL
jgi:hypothetical protein